MDLDLLISELARDEGYRPKPYLDTTGHLTVGIGRNLSDVGVSPDEAVYLAKADVARAMVQLDHWLPWWRRLDEVRQRAVANLAFNLGIHALLEFDQTLSHLRAGEWEQAAACMLQSRWATQVGPRAQRLADMVRTGSQALEVA